MEKTLSVRENLMLSHIAAGTGIFRMGKVLFSKALDTPFPQKDNAMQQFTDAQKTSLPRTIRHPPVRLHAQPCSGNG